MHVAAVVRELITPAVFANFLNIVGKAGTVTKQRSENYLSQF